MSSCFYDEIVDYLLFLRYPDGHDKNQKRILRRKANHYRMENGSLYYSLKENDWRKVIRTEKERKKIMECCHSSAEGIIII